MISLQILMHFLCAYLMSLISVNLVFLKETHGVGILEVLTAIKTDSWSAQNNVLFKLENMAIAT